MLEQLRKYKQMLDEGLISDADYMSLKEKLIGNKHVMENADFDSCKDQALTEDVNSVIDNLKHDHDDNLQSEPIKESLKDNTIHASIEHAQGSLESHHTKTTSFKTAITFLSLLLVGSLIANGWLFYQLRSSVHNTIASQEEKIDSLESVLDANERFLASIDNFDHNADAGFGSDKFYSSDKVIVVRHNDFSKAFLLTCKLNETRVYADCNSDAASVEFADNWVGNTMKVKVVPNHTGATVVTFTNNTDDVSFRVLIVVYR